MSGTTAVRGEDGSAAASMESRHSSMLGKLDYTLLRITTCQNSSKSGSEINLQEMRVNSGRRMNIHFLHFVTVEFVLDLLRELWCQTIARSWFAPPIIYFGMEGMVDGTFWCPVDVPLLDGRRGCRPVRLATAWQVETHAGEYGSGQIQTRMRIGKVETVRQRFAIDVAFKGRERLRERIIVVIVLVVFAI